MRRILIVLSFLIYTLYCQAFDFNQGKILEKNYFQRIPFQRINDKIIVPVSIQGKKYNFLFDTGATFSITKKLFKELQPSIINNAKILDANGAKDTMKVVSLPQINMGSITFADIPGTIVEDNFL